MFTRKVISRSLNFEFVDVRGNRIAVVSTVGGNGATKRKVMFLFWKPKALCPKQFILKKSHFDFRKKSTPDCFEWLCALRYCIVLWWTPDHCLNEIESRREARKSWTISDVPARFCEEVRYASLLISVVTTALLGQFPCVFPYVHLKQSGHKKSSKTLSEHKILTPTPPPPLPLGTESLNHKLSYVW